MDKASIARIRASFTALAPKGDSLMDEFYSKLFATAPAVRSLFPKDLKAQKGHLLAAVGLVVKHADNLAAIEPALLDMGARHVKYGAKPEHYPVVRDTMLAALAKTAGPLWNTQLASDWSAALNAVAGVMVRGAEGASKKAA